MSQSNEIKEFFEKNKIQSILDNKIAFKYKLNLTKDDYDYLNNINNFKEYTEILIAGIAGAGVVYAGFISSLGVFGQIGLGLGLVSTPFGWMALAAGASMASIYGIKKIVKKAENKAYDKLPKYLKTPLDVLAESLANLFIPIFIKIAVIDGKLSNEERNFIIDYLSIQWGYNKKYIESKIEEYYKNINKIKLPNVNKYIKGVSKSVKGLDVENIKYEIENASMKLIQIDGNRNEKEKYITKIFK